METMLAFFIVLCIVVLIALEMLRKKENISQRMGSYIRLMYKMMLGILAVSGTIWMTLYSYHNTVRTIDAVFFMGYVAAGIGLTTLAGWFIKRSRYNIWMMPVYVALLLVFAIQSGFLLTDELNLFGVLVTFVIGLISLYIKSYDKDRGIHLFGALVLTVILGWLVIQLYDTPYKFINKVAYDTREYLQDEGYEISDEDSFYTGQKSMLNGRYAYDVYYFRFEGEVLVKQIKLRYEQGIKDVVDITDFTDDH